MNLNRYIYFYVTTTSFGAVPKVKKKTYQVSYKSHKSFHQGCAQTSRAHYENMPIQIYRKFHLLKTENFQTKNFDIFHISAQNIDCGYSLEQPRWGGSNEYPQSVFFGQKSEK